MSGQGENIQCDKKFPLTIQKYLLLELAHLRGVRSIKLLSLPCPPPKKKKKREENHFDPGKGTSPIQVPFAVFLMSYYLFSMRCEVGVTLFLLCVYLYPLEAKVLHSYDNSLLLYVQHAMLLFLIIRTSWHKYNNDGNGSCMPELDAMQAKKG